MVASADRIDYSFAADPAYRQEFERQMTLLATEGPAEWWYYPEDVLLAEFDRQLDERGTGPLVLVTLTAMWLTWGRANGYAITKPFPRPADPGQN